MWIGIDDTDSPTGGCTTHALTEVIRAAIGAGADLVGEPRLVRLDPNVPGKTRGNAALAAQFGRGTGSRRRAGVIGDRIVWSYTGGRPLDASTADRVVEAAWAATLRASRLGEPGTDPVLVASRRRLPASIYHEAVGRFVPPDTVRGAVEAAGAEIRTVGDPGGVVGAAAAIAWPERRTTWELIAYRAPERWGTPRTLDRGSVLAAERRFPELFLCHDPRTRRLLVAPHTACPILYGLRARRRARLAAAARTVRSEPVDRWFVFRTNQGTGDHRVPRTIGELRPYDAATLVGRIATPPAIGRGGHARWTLSDGEATVACVAFEPTKTLPWVAARLESGDQVELWGGRGADPVFRVEGIRVRSLAAGARSAPACPDCRRPTRSRGHDRGFRCPTCRRRLPPETAVRRIRGVRPGDEFHPTASARRHLAPLPTGPEPTLDEPIYTMDR